MEGTFTRYVNYYRTEQLAQSKQQKSEERDKRRQLSQKFTMVMLEGGDFTWHGPLYGVVSSTVLLIEALRRAILSLEAQIATPFLHHQWRSHGHSQRWTKVIGLCTSPRDFGKALCILVACMKPMIFNSIWREGTGEALKFFAV